MGQLQEKSGIADGWPLRQAADGDERALVELIGAHLDEVHAVNRFLWGEEAAAERTAEAAQRAANAGWSTEEELVGELLRVAAAGTNGRAVPRPLRALALVELAQRAPADAAADIDVRREVLTEELSKARTALRRRSEPLPGGGRCQRARRLLSESMDEGLTPSQARMVQAHLAGCAACRRHDEVLGRSLEAFYERYRSPAPATVRSLVESRLLPEPTVEGGNGSRSAAKVGGAVAERKKPSGKKSPSSGEGSRSSSTKRASAAKRSAKRSARTTAKAAEVERAKDTATPDRIAAASDSHIDKASQVDAMGRDKRREVIGETYGPTRQRQVAVFATFFAIIAALFIGGKLAAGALDKAPKSNADKAPWSKPDAPQTPPQRPQ